MPSTNVRPGLRTHQKFIVVDPDLADWLRGNNALPFDVQVAIDVVGGVLPLHKEAFVKDKLQLDPYCISLLRKLLSSKGVALKSLSIDPDEWDSCRKDSELACSCLNEMGLASVEEKTWLRPLPIAFDERVQYLVGLTNSF